MSHRGQRGFCNYSARLGQFSLVMEAMGATNWPNLQFSSYVFSLFPLCPLWQIKGNDARKRP